MASFTVPCKIMVLALLVWGSVARGGPGQSTGTGWSAEQTAILLADSLFRSWKQDLYLRWSPSDSLPYFLPDRLIESRLADSSLNSADRLVLDYQLVYNLYLRSYLYDQPQYRTEGRKQYMALVNTQGNTFTGSAAYFRTTPEGFRHFIGQLKDAATEEVRDSLIWHSLNRPGRLGKE